MDDIIAIQEASCAKKLSETFALKWCFNFFKNCLERLPGEYFHFDTFLWF